MNLLRKTLTLAICTLAAWSVNAKEMIILLDEGNWQSDNGKMTYFEDGEIISNQWFRDVNGYKLGDTPNDIIQVNDNLLAIAVNWSNIIQFITPQGVAVAATEDVPNNRKLATDGNYVYVTSYAHECLTENGFDTFEKGFVAKIDASTYQVVSTCEVGYEPEGIAYYNGYLFVANSGGYAFQEDHDYESTISVLDAETLQVVRTIDTEQINLAGNMSQCGQYLCVSSPGNYYDVEAATIILDCDAIINNNSDEECFRKIDYAATYNCTTRDNKFFAVGSSYSYYTGEYRFNTLTIDPEAVMNDNDGIEESLPGTVAADIKKMTSPYSIYVNPYTGYIYATDAGNYAAGGKLYQWDPQGNLLGTYSTYINPAHLLALNPAESGVKNISDEQVDNNIYNLQGIKVSTPLPGQIYIQNRHKIIY